MCGICGKSEHRLITTCCGGVTCDKCVTKCELAGIETCPFCRDDMWDTNYVDIQNAFKVFKKVSNLLEDKAKQDEKVSVKTSICKYIQWKVQPKEDIKRYEEYQKKRDRKDKDKRDQK